MRFIYNDTSSSYVELLHKCNRNSLSVDRQKRLCVQVFKSLNGITPVYLNTMFDKQLQNYNFRDNYVLLQPRVNTVTHGLLSYRYHGSKMWNTLALNIKCETSLKNFKCQLNKWKGVLCNCSFCTFDL